MNIFENKLSERRNAHKINSENWTKNISRKIASQLNLSHKEPNKRNEKYLANLKCVRKNGKTFVFSMMNSVEFVMLEFPTVESEHSSNDKMLRKNRQLVCERWNDAVPRCTAETRLKIDHEKRQRHSKRATTVVALSSIPLKRMRRIPFRVQPLRRRQRKTHPASCYQRTQCTYSNHVQLNAEHSYRGWMRWTVNRAVRGTENKEKHRKTFKSAVVERFGGEIDAADVT